MITKLHSCSKCWHLLLHDIKKITIVYITTHVIRKVIKYFSVVKVIGWTEVFQNSIFAWELKFFLLLTNTGSFPWSDKLTQFVVEKMSTNQFVILSSKDGVPWRKLVQLETPLYKHFSLRQPHDNRNALCALPSLRQSLLKRYILRVEIY